MRLLIQIIIAVIGVIVGKKLLKFWKAGKIPNEIKNRGDDIVCVVMIIGIVWYYIHCEQHLMLNDNCSLDYSMRLYQFCCIGIVVFTIVAKIFQWIMKKQDNSKNKCKDDNGQEDKIENSNETETLTIIEDENENRDVAISKGEEEVVVVGKSVVQEESKNKERKERK